MATKLTADDVLLTITEGCRRAAENKANKFYSAEIFSLKSELKKVRAELIKEKAKRDPESELKRALEAERAEIAQQREDVRRAATLLATYADALDKLEKISLADLVSSFKKEICTWGRPNHAAALRRIRNLVQKEKKS